MFISEFDCISRFVSLVVKEYFVFLARIISCNFIPACVFLSSIFHRSILFKDT
jgi:hypothetical protein